jgi:hypothetical protein
MKKIMVGIALIILATSMGGCLIEPWDGGRGGRDGRGDERGGRDGRGGDREDRGGHDDHDERRR